MAIRVIYRSYGGENMKGRPGYYAKLLSLLSFLRAVEKVDVELVFLNDGPIPEDRRSLMLESGEIVELPGVGLRGSYLAALELAASGRWSADDVVWFSEDDYLYLPESMQSLQRLTEAVPEAEYFAFYGSTPTHPMKLDDEPWAHRPAGWRELPPWSVDGQNWVRVYSTTSTFGARIAALQEDMGVFRFCMVPHRTMLRDHDTGLVLQGFEPYSYRDVARSALGLSSGTIRQRMRGAVLAPFELATNLRAHRRPGRRRLLLCSDPNLATHLELGLISGGRHWEAVADDVLAWGGERGIVPGHGH